MSQWDNLISELGAFHKKYGHANASTTSGEDLKLGRWVAAQRYRRRINALTKEQIRQLDALSFVWEPSDLAWENMFQSLLQFIKQNGHANVPVNYRPNGRLARWVQTQRHRRWRNRLSAGRIARLDEVSFGWAVYKRDGARGVEDQPEEADTAEECNGTEQRLYSIGYDTYVQYSGHGAMPPPLTKYVSEHGGEYPPYIPLPRGKTLFCLGELYVLAQRIPWNGRGPLPERVLTYVESNGALPRHQQPLRHLLKNGRTVRTPKKNWDRREAV